MKFTVTSALSPITKSLGCSAMTTLVEPRCLAYSPVRSCPCSVYRERTAMVFSILGEAAGFPPKAGVMMIFAGWLRLILVCWTMWPSASVRNNALSPIYRVKADIGAIQTDGLLLSPLCLQSKSSAERVQEIKSEQPEDRNHYV